jgi:hypothetical protein
MKKWKVSKRLVGRDSREEHVLDMGRCPLFKQMCGHNQADLPDGCITWNLQGQELWRPLLSVPVALVLVFAVKVSLDAMKAVAKTTAWLMTAVTEKSLPNQFANAKTNPILHVHMPQSPSPSK